MTEQEAGGYRRTWIDHALEIEASAQQVYELLVDVDAWPSWTPGLTAIRRTSQGALREGERFTMLIKPAKFHPPLPLPCKALEISPGRIAWGGGVLGSVVRHVFTIEALSPTRTRLHQLEYATNALALLARVAEPGIYKHDLRWQNAMRDRLVGQT
jgi:uncharacterized protein YndB with AHSA1/START domain